MFVAALAGGLVAAAASILAHVEMHRRRVASHRRALHALVSDIVREIQKTSAALNNQESPPVLTGYSKLRVYSEQLALFPVYEVDSVDATLVVTQLKIQLQFLLRLIDSGPQGRDDWKPFHLSVGLMDGLRARLAGLFQLPEA